MSRIGDRYLTFILFTFFLLATQTTSAQIIPDRTLGRENSQISNKISVNNDPVKSISGGAKRDNNLFHSFTEFNVKAEEKVYFDNPKGVENIFTRVTGTNLSKIFGTLGVKGSTNLFLLNPNGIIFGKNAHLDVAGSFLATTADSFLFKNGFNYSANVPSSPPLLTINLPIGVQLGKYSAPIKIQRSTLTVPQQKTLALLGGNINITGGKLNASAGRIELGSVERTASVSLAPTKDGFTFDYGAIDNFGKIDLSQATAVNVSGRGSGNIQIHSKNLFLLDNSAIFANTLGDEAGGIFKLKTTDSIEIIAKNTNKNFGGFYSEVKPNAKGKGGNVEIETKNLLLKNGAIVNVGTNGKGDAGFLNITAKNIDLIGTSENSESYSGLFTSPKSEATGKGGNLNLRVESLSLKNGAVIGTGTEGKGDSGNLSIEAKEINLIGTNDNGDSSSGLFTDTQPESTGKGGNLNLRVESLSLKDGAAIATGTSGKGDGGILDIEAKEINLIGTSKDFQFSSGLFTDTQPESKGRGGDFNLRVERLSLKNGGTIATGTYGKGNSGNLNIKAKEINLIGTSADSQISSGLFTSVDRESTGKGGNVYLQAERLLIHNGAVIETGTSGKGDGGNLSIKAKQIDLGGISNNGQINSKIAATSIADFKAGSIDILAENLIVRDRGEISVSNLGKGNAGDLNIQSDFINLDNFASLNTTVVTGDRGNIKIDTNNLLMRHGSQISTNATGIATGGNIQIHTNFLIASDNSNITAKAIEGKGGHIQITARGIFRSFNSYLDASSELGIDGSIQIHNPEINLNSGLIKLSQETIDPTQKITTGCITSNNDFKMIGKGGLSEDPTLNLRDNIIWNDLRWQDTVDRTSTTLRDRNNREIQMKIEPIIEAQRWKINRNGRVELISSNPENYISLPNPKCLEQILRTKNDSSSKSN
jgi:filamentous hemagglutinin family protein